MKIGLADALRDVLQSTIARTFGTRLVVMGLGMAVSIVAARTLGPAGRGQYAAAAAFAALITQFGNLGLHSAHTYLVSSDRTRVPAILGNTLLVGLGWGTVLGLLTYVLSMTTQQTIVQPELRLLTAVAVPVALTYLLLQNLAMGIERFDLFNRAELSNVVTTLTLMISLVAVALLTPRSLLAANLAGPMVAGSWLLPRLLRQTRLTLSRPLLQRGISYGWRPYALSVAGFAVSRTDLFVVTSRLGDRQAGYYSVALTLVGLFGTFPAIVGQVLFPRLGATSDLAARWRTTGRTALWLGAAAAAVAGLTAAVATPLVFYLFGHAFLDAVPAFRVLLIGAVFMAVHVGVVQYLNSLGFPVGVVLLWIVAALLNWGLNLLLVPRIGLLGGAYASVITYAFLAFGVVVLACWFAPHTTRGRARFAREQS